MWVRYGCYHTAEQETIYALYHKLGSAHLKDISNMHLKDVLPVNKLAIEFIYLDKIISACAPNDWRPCCYLYMTVNAIFFLSILSFLVYTEQKRSIYF